jgi:ElaB/YqjD/DUF883 family membrane-anchored ribosome-binding protein
MPRPEIAMQSDPKAHTGSSTQASTASAPDVERLRSILDQPISTGADFVQQIARSARGLADNLDDGAPQLAQMVRRAAGSAESFSRDIRDKSVHELVEVTQDFARRQPALFVGAAATAGFLLARIIKAGVNAPVTQAGRPSTPVASDKPAASARANAGTYHDA